MVLCRFCGGSPLTVPTFRLLAASNSPFEKMDIGFSCVDGGQKCAADLQFENVADFRRIVKRSGFSDGAMQVVR